MKKTTKQTTTSGMAGEISTYVMRGNRTAEDLQKHFRLTARAAQAIMAQAAYAIGPGGKGYDWYMKQVGSVLRGGNVFEAVSPQTVAAGALGAMSRSKDASVQHINEGVADTSQQKIAVSTLKMSRMGAQIAGGMNHAAAVAVLEDAGWSPDKIASQLKKAGHSGAAIKQWMGESLDEAKGKGTVRITVKKFKGEWAAVYYLNGKFQDGPTYYAGENPEDKQDAKDTAKMMRVQAKKDGFTVEESVEEAAMAPGDQLKALFDVTKSLLHGKGKDAAPTVKKALQLKARKLTSSVMKLSGYADLMAPALKAAHANQTWAQARKAMPGKTLGESTDEGLGRKIFYTGGNIGKAKYTIHMHDGKASHPDGSPFYGIAIFSNKVKLKQKIKELLKQGYEEVPRAIHRSTDEGYIEVPDRLKQKLYRMVQGKSELEFLKAVAAKYGRELAAGAKRSGWYDMLTEAEELSGRNKGGKGKKAASRASTRAGARSVVEGVLRIQDRAHERELGIREDVDEMMSGFPRSDHANLAVLKRTKIVSKAFAKKMVKVRASRWHELKTTASYWATVGDAAMTSPREKAMADRTLNAKGLTLLKRMVSGYIASDLGQGVNIAEQSLNTLKKGDWLKILNNLEAADGWKPTKTLAESGSKELRAWLLKNKTNGRYFTGQKWTKEKPLNRDGSTIGWASKSEAEHVLGSEVIRGNVRRDNVEIVRESTVPPQYSTKYGAKKKRNEANDDKTDDLSAKKEGQLKAKAKEMGATTVTGKGPSVNATFKDKEKAQAFFKHAKTVGKAAMRRSGDTEFTVHIDEGALAQLSPKARQLLKDVKSGKLKGAMAVQKTAADYTATVGRTAVAAARTMGDLNKMFREAGLDPSDFKMRGGVTRIESTDVVEIGDGRFFVEGVGMCSSREEAEGHLLLSGDEDGDVDEAMTQKRMTARMHQRIAAGLAPKLTTGQMKPSSMQWGVGSKAYASDYEVWLVNARRGDNSKPQFSDFGISPKAAEKAEKSVRSKYPSGTASRGNKLSFKESLEEASGKAVMSDPPVIADLRKIVREHQHQAVTDAKGRSQDVDATTANAVVTVYDALSAGNRKKYAQEPLSRMASMAFKMLRAEEDLCEGLGAQSKSVEVARKVWMQAQKEFLEANTQLNKALAGYEANTLSIKGFSKARKNFDAKSEAFDRAIAAYSAAKSVEEGSTALSVTVKDIFDNGEHNHPRYTVNIESNNRDSYTFGMFEPGTEPDSQQGNPKTPNFTNFIKGAARRGEAQTKISMGKLPRELRGQIASLLQDPSATGALDVGESVDEFTSAAIPAIGTMHPWVSPYGSEMSLVDQDGDGDLEDAEDAPEGSFIDERGNIEMLDEAIPGTVFGFRTYLVGALTQYDEQQMVKAMKNPRRSFHNVNALGLYLQAMDRMFKDKSMRGVKEKSSDPDDLRKLAAAIREYFNLPPTNKTAKAIDKFLADGKAPNYPGSSAKRGKKAKISDSIQDCDIPEVVEAFDWIEEYDSLDEALSAKLLLDTADTKLLRFLENGIARLRLAIRTAQAADQNLQRHSAAGVGSKDLLKPIIKELIRYKTDVDKVIKQAQTSESLDEGLEEGASLHDALVGMFAANAGRAYTASNIAKLQTVSLAEAMKALTTLVREGTLRFKRGEGYSLRGGEGLRLPGASKGSGRSGSITDRRTHTYEDVDEDGGDDDDPEPSAMDEAFDELNETRTGSVLVTFGDKEKRDEATRAVRNHKSPFACTTANCSETQLRVFWPEAVDTGSDAMMEKVSSACEDGLFNQLGLQYVSIADAVVESLDETTTSGGVGGFARGTIGGYPENKGREGGIRDDSKKKKGRRSVFGNGAIGRVLEQMRESMPNKSDEELIELLNVDERTYKIVEVFSRNKDNTAPWVVADPFGKEWEYESKDEAMGAAQALADVEKWDVNLIGQGVASESEDMDEGAQDFRKAFRTWIYSKKSARSKESPDARKFGISGATAKKVKDSETSKWRKKRDAACKKAMADVTENLVVSEDGTFSFEQISEGTETNEDGSEYPVADYQLNVPESVANNKRPVKLGPLEKEVMRVARKLRTQKFTAAEVQTMSPSLNRLSTAEIGGAIDQLIRKGMLAGANDYFSILGEGDESGHSVHDDLDEAVVKTGNPEVPEIGYERGEYWYKSKDGSKNSPAVPPAKRKDREYARTKFRQMLSNEAGGGMGQTTASKLLKKLDGMGEGVEESGETESLQFPESALEKYVLAAQAAGINEDDPCFVFDQGIFTVEVPVEIAPRLRELVGV